MMAMLHGTCQAWGVCLVEMHPNRPWSIMAVRMVVHYNDLICAPIGSFKRNPSAPGIVKTAMATMAAIWKRVSGSIYLKWLSLEGNFGGSPPMQNRE